MNKENYYDFSHLSYIDATVDVDLSFIYDQFLDKVTRGGSILDAGCGSGRDMLYFKTLGYSVQGFDSSIKMVESAALYSGCPVKHSLFEQVEYECEFDAIWACASLLHVKRENLDDVFSRLHRALKIGGILYCSFKARDEDFTQGNRTFTCFTIPMLEQFILNNALFSIENIFLTEDAREDRKNEMWTNAVLRAL